jgi:plastocyanin
VRKSIVGALTCALVAAAAPPAAAATVKVKVGDNYFVRDGAVPTVRVSKGTRVKWVFRGDSPHNVKVDRGPVSFGSSTMTSGSFAKKVRRKGTYRLYCSVHGADDQRMKLVVR